MDDDLSSSGVFTLTVQAREREGRIRVDGLHLHADLITDGMMRAVSIGRVEASLNAGLPGLDRPTE